MCFICWFWIKGVDIRKLGSSCSSKIGRFFLKPKKIIIKNLNLILYKIPPLPFRKYYPLLISQKKTYVSSVLFRNYISKPLQFIMDLFNFKTPINCKALVIYNVVWNITSNNKNKSKNEYNPIKLFPSIY